MEDKAFSSIDLVGQCLIDKIRSLAFKKAIKETVQTNHVVLDVGTGSGIMSLFAAQAGAKKVVAIEYDHYVAGIAAHNFKNNNFGKKIKLLVGNAKNLIYPKNINFDVVIMEMLTTGMVDEFQIQAINNLHNRKVVNANTIFIPQAQRTYISLADTDFDLYGLKIEMVQHLWKDFPDVDRCKIVSNKELLHEICFNSPSNEFFTRNVYFKAKKDAIVNSVYLSSVTILTEDSQIGDTLSLNGPVVFPIKPFKVKRNQSVRLNISYKFGGGFESLHVKFLKK